MNGKAPILATLMAQDPSLKRLAWAYGCAKKDSEEERQLREALLTKADEMICRQPTPDDEPELFESGL